MKNSVVPMDSWPALLPLYVGECEASVGSPLYTTEEICDHFGITPEHLERYKEQPKFRAEVRAAIQELKDSSSVLRKKAKAQLELYVDKTIPSLMGDSDQPMAEKVKLMRFLAEVSRVLNDPADKARAEAEAAKALPQQVQPVLNLILTAAPGTTVGAVIPQQAERVINEQ